METLTLLLEDFQYVLIISGALSVRVGGVKLMLLCLVDNLDLIMLIVNYKL